MQAVSVIRSEHARLNIIMHMLEQLRQDLAAGKLAVDVTLLGLCLDYVAAFLDTFHHPKEDDHLMPALLRRDPSAQPAIADIETDHQVGPEMLAALRTRLDAYRGSMPGAREALVAALGDYIQHQRAHIQKEEAHILPLCKQVLTPEDWQPIDAAFLDHDDPAFGEVPQARFRQLQSAIVHLAPPPHGLGGLTRPRPADGG